MSLVEIPVETVNYVGRADLPIDAGSFTAHAFDGPTHTHLVLSKGALDQAEAPLVRLHSECLTGDALRSRRCDCGSQLQGALERIEAEGVGAVIYLAGHEGRGIGLAEKIRAYALQDEGADTVDANVLLGHEPDERDYADAAGILAWFGVQKVRLLSNNPTKATALESHAIEVAAMVGQPGERTCHNERYLEAKRTRMGHRLDPSTRSASGEEER